MSLEINEANRDLFLLDVLGGALVLTILLLPELKALRIALGIPFVLFLPGYFLVAALFPGKEDLEGLERLALSLGLSLALVPLIGLVLNYTPFGIRLWPVTLSLYLFMLGMTGAARWRREKLPSEERFKVDISSHLPDWKSVGMEDKILIVGSVIAVVGAGIGGSFLASSRHGEEFTEFYILGPGGKMENYPTDLRVGETGTVIIGIQNHEYETENYSVLLTLDNERLEEIGGIQLNHDENWQNQVTFEVLEAGENRKLEFLLYTENGVEPYRKLHLWLTVENSG